MFEKSASEGQTRQKSAKRRSLHGVNEYFEPIFNAVWSSAVSFQTEPNSYSVNAASLRERYIGKTYRNEGILI
ncbi:hypothetical protein E0L35_14825 [Halomonas sp. ATBC28]|nr:hypothetical protein E0L35_14825 [Halomonas sp. ATBC28]